MLTGSKSRTRKIKTKQISVGFFANNKLGNVSNSYVLMKPCITGILSNHFKFSFILDRNTRPCLHFH